jgi:hypothetical protein
MNLGVEEAEALSELSSNKVPPHTPWQDLSDIHSARL